MNKLLLINWLGTFDKINKCRNKEILQMIKNICDVRMQELN
jgi:hypothetical protein